MIIREVLSEAVKKFTTRTNPQLEAEILLSHIIKKPREYLFSHPEYKLSKLQITNYQLLIAKRLKGLPTAYLLGEKEFYGLKFLVNKNVLIPRPETELMVEIALAEIKKSAGPITIVDVGTGSGCVIVVLAKAIIFNFKFQIFNQFLISNFKFYATDISEKALVVAKKNAQFHKISKKIKFIKGDLLVPLLNSKLKISAQGGSALGGQNSKFIITANLPYLTPSQIKNSPTIKYEPKLALSAGPDGLKYYRRLFQQLKKAGLQNFVLLCEIDPGQKKSIAALAKKILPDASLKIKKDLRGHSRLAVIRGR